jgi:aldehyde:ferredoxin oxidoreductase
MVGGYAGKFLEVNLTSNTCQDFTIRDDVLRQYLGGRALAAKILWDRLGATWGAVDPFGPENILTFFTGPLTGYYPGMRLCVSGKSPATNSIIGSTVAGEFSLDLKCAGYDGVIVTGKAEGPVYLYIEDGAAEIKDARHLWGKDGKQTIRLVNKDVIGSLTDRRGNERLWKEPGMLYIGPAGETATRLAAVIVKWTHGAGYGCYGGVMGSKNLKAIVVTGTRPVPAPADMAQTLQHIAKITQKCLANDSMRRWGTGSAGYEVGAGSSSEPVKNWQEEWHDERGFGVDEFERRVWVKRYWGDYGCPTTCLKVSAITAGPFKGAITDNPDYEIQAYMGTNLGIFEPEGNVYVAALGDDLGLCGIQGGNVLGFAGELYQRGVLTRDDIGFPLKWGDAQAFGRLVKMIANREGIGDILAEGSYRAALKIGQMKGLDLLPYVVHAKGMAIGAHGTRSGLDYEPIIAYATSVQGSDHTSCGGMAPNKNAGDILWGFADSAVICGFNIFEDALAPMWGMLRSVTGWHITASEWYSRMGPRMMAIQRASLLVGGPDHVWSPSDDDNPPRFYEPLPSGPLKGKTTDRAQVLKDKQRYYNSLGWSAQGIPRRSTLKRLGIEHLEPVFAPMRRR